MSFSKTAIAEFIETIIDSMPQNEHFYHIRKSFACLPKSVICVLIESGCKSFENVLAATDQVFSLSKDIEMDSWSSLCSFRDKHNKLKKQLKIKSIANTAFILAQVLCPSTKEVQHGPVYCNSLGIHFPVLYRATVVTTIDHLKKAGIDYDSESKPGTWFSFELDMHNICEYIGDVTWDTVTCIKPTEQDESIMIRFHKTYELASAYLQGFIDSHYDYQFLDMCGLYKTEQGYFTYLHVPSEEEWKGPLVFYLAQIPISPFEWAFIVGPDGKPRDVSDFGY